MKLIQTEFFLLLKQLHIKPNQGSGNSYPEVLEALRWVKPVVDFFNQDIQSRRWDQNMERKLKSSHVKNLMEALNHVTFAAVNSFKGSMYILQHTEIIHFLGFIDTVRGQIEAEHFNDIINIYFGTPEQTIEKYWHYLKRYPIRSLEEDKTEATKPTSCAQQLDKFKEDVETDINALISKAGMLYVLGLRIQLVHHLKRSIELNSFFSSFEEFLDICQLNLGILRVVSKPIIGVDNNLEYFAILLIQDINHSFSEVSLIQTLKQELLRVYRRCSPDLEVHITNFNMVLRTHETIAHQGDFFLSDFSIRNDQLVWKWIFGFLFYWESYQKIGIHFFEHIGQEYAHSSRKKHDLSYLKLNEPQEIYYPYLLKKLPRIKLVWSTTHLSSYAANYLEHVTVVYKEFLSTKKIHTLMELVVDIENFMLTLKEAAHIAFESSPSIRQQLMEYQIHHIEELATRPLLQFIQLLTRQQLIDELAHKLITSNRSKLLHYFLMIYQQKMNAVEKKAELEAILGLDISHNKGRNKLERLIADFIYHDELFEKKAIKTKPLLDPPSLQKDAQSSVAIKLIDIPRHKHRLEAVRRYLKSAMKSDVIVVHYQFSCVGVKQHKGLVVEEHNLAENKEHTLPQQALSKALYTMLHAGKRRMPLSQITAYLGYWEGTSMVEEDYTSFSANIYFVFKSNVLQKYEDLQDELSKAWQSACHKFFSSLSPEQAQQYNLIKQGLIYKASCLSLPVWYSSLSYDKNQLLLETINKKRKKEFIDHLSNFVVYKDVLNDKIYQDIPKWLIRGTESRVKKKTKQSK